MDKFYPVDEFYFKEMRTCGQSKIIQEGDGVQDSHGAWHLIGY